MTRPLHRSRGFWLGFAGLGLVVGMWVSSMWWSWQCHGSIRQGSTFAVSNAPSFVYVHWARNTATPGAFSPVIRFSSDRAIPGGRWFPAPRLDLQKPMEGLAPSEGFREIGFWIPHWLIVLIYLPLGMLLAAWRWRVRSRATTPASP
jgi:hypothetical protein